MTTYIFAPTIQTPYSFKPTLDGQSYQAVVTWSLMGKRYYFNLFTLDGERVVTLPLIGSKGGYEIETVSWYHGFVTLTTVNPHGFLVGATSDLVVAGMVPLEYNGSVRAFVTGLDTIQYPLSVDPGDITTYGYVSYDINLVAGYFDTSKIVFRQANNQFEVTP